MRSRVLGFVAIAFSLIGLGASIASLVDYFGPTFCSETGCATVRASAWAHPLGIPMPLFGIAYFAAMAVLAFTVRPRARLVLALAGGAWALGLVALQAFVIHAWCKLCLIADPAAVLAAIAVAGGAGVIRPSWPRVGATVPALAAIVLALRFVTHAPEPTVAPGTPEVVAREQVAGKVTVVEFVDFECPFCRAMQGRLAPALERVKEPVHLVRKMVPLPQHEHAFTAALAWCCAQAQGKGDAMAAALFSADPSELTPEGCEQIAGRVGCDLARYRRELPTMIGRVAADLLEARGAGIRSLPTTFIGSARVVGAGPSEGELVTLLDRAAR